MIDKATPRPWRTGWLVSYDGLTGEPLAFIYRRPPDDPRETADNRICIRGGEDPVADADLIVSAVNQYDALQQAVEALRWLTHTSCDVGKDGEPVTMNEHIAAIEAGKAALAAVDEAQR